MRRTTDAYASLQSLGRPVVTTRDAAVTWGESLPTTARTLARLADAGLVTKIRQGIWTIGNGAVDPTYVLPILTNPFPSYVSGWSALFAHGMIEQIPHSVFAVSLDRPKTIDTEIGRFEIHRVQPEIFGGFDGGSGSQAGVARSEKALFDTVYVFVVHRGHVTLPELELPESFDESNLNHWIDAVTSERLRTMVRRALSKLIDGAALESAS
jgi:predicted transcriptional regulator of viral defense system